MTDPVLKSLMIIREDAHRRGMVDVGSALDHSLRHTKAQARRWEEEVQRQASRRINLPIEGGPSLPINNPVPRGAGYFPKWEGGNDC